MVRTVQLLFGRVPVLTPLAACLISSGRTAAATSDAIMCRGRIAHWMLKEVHAPYRVHVLDLDKREHESPEYLGWIEPAMVDRMFSRPRPGRPGALGYGSYADAPRRSASISSA
jgi:hypothetical protein